MDILDVLNDLEELIDESPRIPLVGKVLVDDELILDMVDHIRTALPEEMRQAKAMVMEQEKMMAEARKEAERIIKEAKEEIHKRVSEDDIVRQAKYQANDIMDQAKALSREIKIGAYQFTDELLKTSEDRLETILLQVKKAREELRTPPKGEQEAASAEQL